MKYKMKKVVSLLLAMLMVFQLAACGKKDGGNSSGAGNGKPGSNSGSSAEVSASSKEGVYTEEEVSIDGITGELNFLASKYFDDEKTAYLINQNYEAAQPTYQLIVLSSDSLNSTVVSMQLPIQSTKSEMEPSEEVAPGDDPGNMLKDKEIVEELPADVVDGVDDGIDISNPSDDMIDVGYGYNDSYEYINYSNFVFTNDKQIIGLCNYNHSLDDQLDEDGYPMSQNEYYICTWGMDGSILDYYLLEFMADNDGWIQNLYVTADNKVEVVTYNYESGEYKAYLIGEAAAVEKEIPFSQESVLENISGSCILKDGRFFASYYDYSMENSKQKLAVIDLSTGNVSEEFPIPDDLAAEGVYNVYPGVSMDVITTTDKAVWGFNLGDTKAVKLLDYINSDLNSSYMNSVMELDNDHILGIYYDMETWSAHFSIFTRVDPKDVKDKTILTIGAFYLGSDIRKRIVDFNKSSDSYRFVVKEYEDNSAEDYNEGYTKLNNDILAGNMPDILYVNSGANLDLNAYVSKGLIANVDELMAADPEISSLKYMDNVFEAFRMNGKLYYVIPTFEVRTLFAKSSRVAGKTNWTMEEFLDMAKKLPEGSQMFDMQTQSGFMSMLMNYCGADFVDVNTGKCDFNNETFIGALEFAKTLPEEIDWDNIDESYWESSDTQYLDDRTLLMESYMYDIKNYNSYVKGYFGEEVTPIGFPTTSDMSSILNPYEFYMISAKSASIDGAWEFIRELLLPEYQNNITYEIPVLEESFDKWANKGKEKSSYEDYDGSMVEYDDTIWLGEKEITINPMTDSEIEAVKSFIRGINKPVYNNEAVLNIITEEASSFFAGQKSASDVAAIIQSRVQIYVSENS